MKSSIVDSSWLPRDGFRLGAGYYCNDGQQALRYFSSLSLQVNALKELCEALYIPKRFKRPYVNDPMNGFPYITGSTMLLAQPREIDTYLSKTLTPNLSDLILRKGMILVTCSGIIGRSVIVNNDLDGCVGSPDLLRIVPKLNLVSLGYLYSYLTTPIGQSLIQMQTYGSVIDHIEAHHIYDLPVPRLPHPVEMEIAQKVEKAWSLREKANEQLNRSLEKLYTQLGVHEINDPKFYLEKSVKTFSISRQNLDLRLDARNYDPPSLEAGNIIAKRADCKLLGSVTRKIFHPFRMNMIFVEKQYGVPFLMGGEIIQFRYLGNKYMSPLTLNYQEYILEHGWILLTRSGTTGRPSYVGKYFEGWAASEEGIRLIPDETLILPGYLYTFFRSDLAQKQIRRIAYGSVIEHIRESHLANILVPIPPIPEQQQIHESNELAFDLRYEANILEDEARSILLKAIGLEY